MITPRFDIVTDMAALYSLRERPVRGNPSPSLEEIENVVEIK